MGWAERAARGSACIGKVPARPRHGLRRATDDQHGPTGRPSLGREGSTPGGPRHARIRVARRSPVTHPNPNIIDHSPPSSSLHRHNHSSLSAAATPPPSPRPPPVDCRRCLTCRCHASLACLALLLSPLVTHRLTHVVPLSACRLGTDTSFPFAFSI